MKIKKIAKKGKLYVKRVGNVVLWTDGYFFMRTLMGDVNMKDDPEIYALFAHKIEEQVYMDGVPALSKELPVFERLMEGFFNNS